MEGKLLDKNFQRLKYVVTDWVTTNLAFFLFNISRYKIIYGFPLDGEYTQDFHQIIQFLDQPKLLWEQLLIPIFALAIYWLSGYYATVFSKSRLQEFITTSCSAVINTGLIYLALLTNDQLNTRTSNWGLLLILFLLLFSLVYIGRYTITRHTLKQLMRQEWNINTLIIGNSSKAHETAVKLASAKANLGYRVKGFVKIPDEEDAKQNDNEVFPFENIKEVCRNLAIDQLIISPADPDDDKILQLLSSLFELDIPIRIEPDTLSYMTSAIHMQDIYAEPFIDLANPMVSHSYQNIKRVIDVTLSSLALLLVSPIMLGVAIAIKLDSKGKIIYSQERIGRHRIPFRIYKFRSMREDAEASGPQLSRDNDPRITRVGKIIRKYRLDELPQFWNVIKGDMSLVGPRPERAYYINRITKMAPYYILTHQIRPGITSWGMVKYGYASSVEEMVIRTRYDLIYLSNLSLSIDLKILIYTIQTVIKGKGK